VTDGMFLLGTAPPKSNGVYKGSRPPAQISWRKQLPANLITARIFQEMAVVVESKIRGRERSKEGLG
jgi:hypothetical protein